MLHKHKLIFVTFHPADLGVVRRAIARLEKRFSDRTFTGRHKVQNQSAALAAIQDATLTLVLQASKTMRSRRVNDDVAASLKKEPPNVILRIQLVEVQVGDGGALGRRLDDLGVEVVPCDIGAIASAVNRSDIAYRVQAKLRNAAASGASAGTGCSR